MLSVIIAAAGQGSRMGTGKNKLRLELDGEPILVRSLQRLSRCAEHCADRVEFIVVCHAGDMALWQGMNLPQRFPLLRTLVLGGDSRAESVRRGLAAVAPQSQWVAVHDGARPLLEPSDWQRLLAVRAQAEAAILAVPVKETIKRAAEDGETVGETLPRHLLWSAQTPQLFARALIETAYAAASAELDRYTDDASLVEAQGAAVRLVPGSYTNIKITTPEDLPQAERIWREQENAYRQRL